MIDEGLGGGTGFHRPGGENWFWVPLPDGPVRPIRAVLDEEGVLVGELMVWLRDGQLIGMEQPWFGDRPPTTWPEVGSLDFT